MDLWDFDSAVVCNSAQAACFETEPGYDIEPWLTEASNAGVQVLGQRIGGLESGSSATQDSDAVACTDFGSNCPAVDCIPRSYTDGCLRLINHLHWPDGVYNNASTIFMDREIDMLQFLKNHPL